MAGVSDDMVVDGVGMFACEGLCDRGNELEEVVLAQGSGWMVVWGCGFHCLAWHVRVHGNL